MWEFLHRANGTLKQRISEFDINYEPWDHMIVQLSLVWGGHTARFRHFDPGRPSLRVLTIWNYVMIMTRVGDHTSGKQLHSRYLHVWRWEAYHYKHTRRKWCDHASDREEWKELVGKA